MNEKHINYKKLHGKIVLVVTQKARRNKKKAY